MKLEEDDRIWCDNCSDIKPIRLAAMATDLLNDHPATDLLCADCAWIIATVHHLAKVPA